MQVSTEDSSAPIFRVTLSLCIDVAISFPFLTIYGSFLPSDRRVYCKSLINEVYWYRNCVVSCLVKVFNIHIFVTPFPYKCLLHCQGPFKWSFISFISPNHYQARKRDTDCRGEHKACQFWVILLILSLPGIKPGKGLFNAQKGKVSSFTQKNHKSNDSSSSLTNI